MAELSLNLLRYVAGVGAATVRAFRDAGYRSLNDLEGVTLEQLTQVNGVGQATAEAILQFLSSAAVDEPVRAYRHDEQRKNIPPAGCQNITHLHTELKDKGFDGHYASVHRAIKRMLKDGKITYNPITQPTPIPRLSVTEATWLLVHPDDRLDEIQLKLRNQLCQVGEEINMARELVQSFCKLLRQRLVDALDGWLEEAEQSGIKVFENFAAGLRRDYEAVGAALTHEWSNGQVERQVNRLKFIKRQGYGRAKFDLLRKRVLGQPAPG